MSRRFFEQIMLDELEPTNFPSYQRWYASPNPVCFRLADFHQDFRRPSRMNRCDFCAFDYLRPPYWMPPSFVFPGLEPFHFVRRNDKRIPPDKNFQHSKHKRSSGADGWFTNRLDDINFRASRMKSSNFVPHFDRRYPPNWNRETPHQIYQNTDKDRNTLQTSSKSTNIDLSSKDILDQQIKNLEQMFENKNPSSESFVLKKNRTNNGENRIESEISKDSLLESQCCKPLENDWKDEVSNLFNPQYYEEKSYSASFDFSKNYEFWDSCEEQQQIVDVLKETNRKHDEQLFNDIFTAQEENPRLDDSDSIKKSLPQQCSSSDDDDDDDDEDTITILLPQQSFTIIPEEVNEEEAELKTCYREKSVTGIFEEFQSIFAGSPEKKIINTLTKESMKKQNTLLDGDVNSVKKTITNEDKDAVKSCLKFENLDDIVDEPLGDTSQISKPSLKDNCYNNLCTENKAVESLNNSEIFTCDAIQNSECENSLPNFQSSPHNDISFKTKKVSKEIIENKSNNWEVSGVSMEIDNVSTNTSSNVFSTSECQITANNANDAFHRLNDVTSTSNALNYRPLNLKSINSCDTDSVDIVKKRNFSNNYNSPHKNSQFSFQNSVTNHCLSRNNSQDIQSILKSYETSTKRNYASYRASQQSVKYSTIFSQLPNKHSPTYDTNQSEENRLASSEPFLPRDKNEVVYKRISISEIFDSVRGNSTNYLEELQNKENHIKHSSNLPLSPSFLSPSDYLKHILGIGKESNCDTNDHSCQKNNSLNETSHKTSKSHQFAVKSSKTTNTLTSNKCHYSSGEPKRKVSGQNLCCLRSTDQHKNCETVIDQETKKKTLKENQVYCIYPNKESQSKDAERCKSPAEWDKTTRRSKCSVSSAVHINNSFTIRNSSKRTNSKDTSNANLTEIISSNCPTTHRNENWKIQKGKNKLPKSGNTACIDSKETSKQSKIIRNSYYDEINILGKNTNTNFEKEDRSEGYLKHSENEKLLTNNVNATDIGSVKNEKKSELSCTLKNSHDDFLKAKKKYRKKKKKENISETNLDKNSLFVIDKCGGNREYTIENSNTKSKLHCTDIEACNSISFKKENLNAEHDDKIVRSNLSCNSTFNDAAKSKHGYPKDVHTNKEISSQKTQKCEFSSKTSETNSKHNSHETLIDVSIKSKTCKEERNIYNGTSWSGYNFHSNHEYDNAKPNMQNRKNPRIWKNRFRNTKQNDSLGVEMNIKEMPTEDKILKNDILVYDKHSAILDFKDNSRKLCKYSSKQRENNFRGENRKSRNMKTKYNDESSSEALHVQNEFSSIQNSKNTKLNAQQSANKNSAKYCEGNKRAKSVSENLRNNRNGNDTFETSKFRSPELLKSIHSQSYITNMISSFRYKIGKLLQDEEIISLSEKRKSSDIPIHENIFKFKGKCQKPSSSFSCERNNSVSKFLEISTLIFASWNHMDRNGEPLYAHDSKFITDDSVIVCTLKPSYDSKGPVKHFQKYIPRGKFEQRLLPKAERKDLSYFRRNIFKKNYKIKRIQANKSEKVIIHLPPCLLRYFLQAKQAVCYTSKPCPLLEIPLQIYVHDVFSQFSSVKFSASPQNCLQLSLSTLVSQNVLQNVPFLLKALFVLFTLGIPWSRNHLKEVLALKYSKKEENGKEKNLTSFKEAKNEEYVRAVLKCYDILSCYISSMKDANTI